MSVTKSIEGAVASFGGAATIGDALGWGFKKLLKILLVLVVAFTALIAIPIGYLTYEGVISINWDKLYVLLRLWLRQSQSPFQRSAASQPDSQLASRKDEKEFAVI